MAGISYMDYLVPGIILMSVITNSYGNVVASFYSSKFQRNIEELLIAPVPGWVILSGYVCGGVLRGLASGLVVAGIGFLFTRFHLAHPLVVVAVFLLTALLFSLAGFINAVFAKSFDDISIVPNFILTPLVYLGGVFYSIELLPEIWRKISMANPILYMVNGFRYGFIGITDVRLDEALAIIFACVVVLVVWALFLLHRGTGLKT